ncbi:MAG: TPM domain-containing protein [Ignavibacteriales bacterium]|nr:MAG: TPM domain-containing protein [Ignavibacteriales bacterium]
MSKLILFIFILSQAGISQPDIPQLKQWATDLSSTLSSGEINSLNRRLKTYEDTTSNQLVLLMIPTLDDYPIEMFTHEVAEKNKIGTKENNNGVLFFIARNDRKLRLEVGYGLEGALPDALANSIIRNDIVPYFKRNEFYNGIVSGLNAIVAAIGGEYANSPEPSDESQPVSVISTILFILIAIIISFLRKGSGRGGGGFIYYGGGFGGSGGRSSGSFGSFGGFSGGGGSFGGGGSSGSW